MPDKPMGKVLLITDAKKEGLSGTLCLKDKKIEVHPFSEAIDAIHDCHVDLILLDCNLDVDEGLKILKENKTSCPNIPNIFITDLGPEGVVLRAFRAGARDFFRKPVNISELQNTVEGLLSVKKSCREKRSPYLKNVS
jgi:DNA-binding response OmpR family regulator